MRRRLQPHHIYIVEAALTGAFFVQSLRFLIGMIYSRTAGASIVNSLPSSQIPTDIPNLAEPSIVSTEVTYLIFIVVALPLLTLILGRFKWWLTIGTIILAVGRFLMLSQADSTSFTPTMAASLAVAGGLVVIAQVVRFRLQSLPYFFILGLGIDQLLRAVGNTVDPSFDSDYQPTQIVLSLIAIALSILVFIWERRRLQAATDTRAVSADHGLLPFWSGIALAGLLFIELSLLALPNAIAGRADADYTTFVPFTLLATLLPLLPQIRVRARNFILLFDSGVRGWAWLLIIALMIVFGTRIQTVLLSNDAINIGEIQLGAIALVISQFMVSMMWWWLARPRGEQERTFAGLWLIISVGVFALLIAGDFFTYEYAFVRNLRPELDFLNPIIPPLLRGFRGLGLPIILFALFLAGIPMLYWHRRVPWQGGSGWATLFSLLTIVGAAIGAAFAARPPLVESETNIERMRVATYNIHAAYDEFFNYDLEQIAFDIQVSGASVVLLQEIEAGRLTSFGVDQPLWLARQLGMDVRFYPTNEGLQGLAVLSKVPIVFDEGDLLTSEGNQTGLQHVQIRPDDGIITIYNTWLGLLQDRGDNRPIEEQEQDQQQQLEELLLLIAEDHLTPEGQPGQLGRTILGGTFNNVPDSPLLERVREIGLIDPHDTDTFEDFTTLRRTGIRARVDYLWLNSLELCGANVLQDSASDHHLAFASVKIRRGADCEA
ncbi:MAG: hypothetical protein D6737_09315 [Chloroflexi bacterium]|nr:MAG: hypothetical protein D6737_09315 [Chloroflexota bacterium]